VVAVEAMLARALFEDPRVPWLVAAAYVALCRHPHDAWRAQNQTLYGYLRDHIANRLGQPAEIVQAAAEAIANDR
jgi:hypothetical protein